MSGEFSFARRIDTIEVNGVMVVRRDSYVLGNDAGAVEAHREPAPAGYPGFASGYFGGVEIHSPVQLYGFMEEPTTDRCSWTKDGKCWGDGSSLAFERDVAHLFDNPAAMRRELLSWHTSHFTATEVTP